MSTIVHLCTIAAGAIKDSVVGEEAIIRFYLNLLASNPEHLAALKASQAPGYRSSRGKQGGSSDSSSAAGVGKGSSSIAQALITAAEHTGQVSVWRCSTPQ